MDIEEIIEHVVEQAVEEALVKQSAITQTIYVHVYRHVVPGTPVKANLVLGPYMPGQITVDTTNETATVEFRDDKGNVTAAPDGAVVTFSSSNPAVLTVASDPANPLQGDISPLTPGTSDVGVDIAGAVEPDGTAFAVTPVTVTVSPGAAAAADLALSV